MKPTVKEIAIFGMLGALMYATKLFMEILADEEEHLEKLQKVMNKYFAK